MDAFKPNEIERMRLGGNQGWRDFFEAHEDTTMMGLTWDEATIAERYSGTVGEEWKERLTAKVEEREYVPSEKKPTPTAGARSSAAAGGDSRSGTPLSGRRGASSTPPTGGQAATSGGKVKVDDKFFAKLGADNAGRREDLPPSQGGKYAGFGSTPHPSTANSGAGGAAPSLDELQKDPLGALTKGFGWFASTVTKTAKDVNEGYIQPTAQKVRGTQTPIVSCRETANCMFQTRLLTLRHRKLPQQIAESDLAKQAQVTAAQVARQAQQGARTANDGFMRFVEGDQPGARQRAAPLDETRKDFWDDFNTIAEQRQPASSSIGTAAMGKGGRTGAGPAKKKDDDWDEW